MRRGAACVLLLLLVSACGSGGHPRRDAVNAYLRDVKGAQASLVAGQGQVDIALQSFSLQRMTAFQLRQLENARKTVAKTLRRVRALDPPPDAKRLDELLVRRLALQLALVDELLQTARDVPRLAAVTVPLRAAARQLGSDLGAISAAQKTVPAGGSAALLARYGAAFGAYGDSLEPVLATLAAPPRTSLLAPALAAERRAITRSVTLCATIRNSLGRGDIAAANRAIASLFSVSQTLNGPATRAAQQAAARAYNARIRKIEQLAIAITGERNRLVQRVG